MRSPTASLLKRTLLRKTAKFGFCWIAVLVLVAVFAPFLANSKPLYVEHAGISFSPLLQALTPLDFAWLGGLLGCIATLYLPLNGGTKLVATLLTAMLLYFVSPIFLQQESVVVHEQYRELAQQGKLDNVVMPLIPYSPQDYLRDQGGNGLLAPTTVHWLGTEENGADVLSRMIHASRVALSIGFVATGIALFVGLLVGGIMGFYAGAIDMIGMRLVEIFESIPTLFLLLTFVAFYGSNLFWMMVIIGLTSWTGYARYLRAEFLKLREQEYVIAAQAAGIPTYSIIFRHLLPNGIAPVLVVASFGVASAILAEATLSFLGLGPVDAPSWGQMLNQAVQSSSFNWWMAVFPGGAIFMTVFAYNLIGDAMRDAIDPSLSVRDS